MTRLEIVALLVAHGPATRKPDLAYYFGIAEDLISEDVYRTQKREAEDRVFEVRAMERELAEKKLKRWWRRK